MKIFSTVNIFCLGKSNGRFGKTKLALYTNYTDVFCRAGQHRSCSSHSPHLTLKHSTELRGTRAQNNYTEENNNSIRNKESTQDWDKSLRTNPSGSYRNCSKVCPTDKCKNSLEWLDKQGRCLYNFCISTTLMSSKGSSSAAMGWPEKLHLYMTKKINFPFSSFLRKTWPLQTKQKSRKAETLFCL